MVALACSPPDPGIIPDPTEPEKKQLPKEEEPDLFPIKNPGQGDKAVPARHLASCEKKPCNPNMECVSLFSGADNTCLFKCDPDKGTGDKQNPDCLLPENCIRLTDGSGVCIYFPGQLYGTGSYKAIIRHKAGEKCLMRYGGCDEGLICVDTKRSGDFGICTEECFPATLDSSKRKPECKTPGTTCKSLVSGMGACLP